MEERNLRNHWRSQGERLGLGLITLTAAAQVLGLVRPETLGMAPLIGGLLLLLITRVRQQPLSSGWLVLLLLTLRLTLRGSDRYLPAEISLSDALMVLIAAAASFRAGARPWREFQQLFSCLIPLSGAAAWLMALSRGGTGPLAADTLSAAQSSLLFGLCLCLSLPRMIDASRDSSGTQAAPAWQRAAGWGLLSLLSAGLCSASGGFGALTLAALAVGISSLIPWSQAASSAATRRLRATLLAALATGGGVAAALLRIAASTTLAERLALLHCFLSAPFGQIERLLLGVGFTNSSGWLCADLQPGATRIQADNLPAQIAADNGLIALAAIAALVLWLAARSGRLIRSLQEPTATAGVSAALFTLLALQGETGWGQSTLLQVLIGLQVGFLSLRTQQP